MASDVAGYFDWFTWAKDGLGRELDSTHAAAEAGLAAVDAGETREAAESAARAAAAAPTLTDARTIALAEWAYWARKELGVDASDALNVAGRALDNVEATHDLQSAIASVQPGRAAAARPAAGLWRSHWQVLVGLMAASAIVGAIVTAGIMAATNPTSSGEQQPTRPLAALTATVVGDTAWITVSGYPPDAVVYIYVDDSLVGSTHSDGSGSAALSVPFPLGGHNVRGCLDASDNCPASAFAVRS